MAETRQLGSQEPKRVAVKMRRLINAGNIHDLAAVNAGAVAAVIPAVKGWV